MAHLLPGRQNAPQRDGEKIPNYFGRAIVWMIVTLALSILSGSWMLTAYDATSILRLLAQSIIITIGAIFPMAMYAYFAQTRHAVIWREFKQRLLRLGMKPEDYDERFESIYGGGTTRAGEAAELMVAAPSLAIDLPLKALVAEDGQNKVTVTFNDPDHLRERHGFPAELTENLAGAGALIAKAVE